MRSQELHSVEVDEMIGVVGNPDFRLPCDLGSKLPKRISIEKRRYKHKASRTTLGQCFQVALPHFVYRIR
jgi:hypothetical protein